MSSLQLFIFKFFIFIVCTCAREKREKRKEKRADLKNIEKNNYRCKIKQLENFEVMPRKCVIFDNCSDS